MGSRRKRGRYFKRVVGAKSRARMAALYYSRALLCAGISHEEYGDIIDEGAPDHQLATLFGTKTGIDALAEFVKKSKAFQKTRAAEIP